MFKAGFRYQPDGPNWRSHPLRTSIPLKATERTESGTNEIEGRLEAIAEGEAQICLDQPLRVGTEIEVLVEFKDQRNREIRFRYEGEIASAVIRQWYQMEVSFKGGGGISGKDAREVLAELFPEKA